MCSLAVRTKSVTSSSDSGASDGSTPSSPSISRPRESGRAPDRREFLDRHWDLTDGLVSFFANEDLHEADGRPARCAGTRADLSPSRLSKHRRSDRGSRRRVGLGEFELLNEIARGGMGVVYKARHKRLNRVVALKTIRPGVSCSTDVLVQRLRAEAKVVAALDHPNIVPLYEIGEEDGYPYLILKLIPGGDLERHRPRLSRNPRAAVRLMAKVARTVQYAHSHGVLHRDLKPSNILLDLEGVPHVTDFGLARCIETESSLTQTGLILGTPAYMAPEQASGSPGELTEAVDVYGLGAVLYKLLTGRPPFQADTTYEVLEQVRERVPSSLRPAQPCGRPQPRCHLLEVPREGSRPPLSFRRGLVGRPRSAGSPARRSPLGARAAPSELSRWYHQNRKRIAYLGRLVGLVAVFVLAGITTATIICNYELAGDPRAEPLRVLARSLVQYRSQTPSGCLRERQPRLVSSRRRAP